MHKGVTPTERYLGRLARRSFLSLWSFSGLYRDQGNKGGHGKEIVDLLVVFEDDVLLFSDKDIQFPTTGNIDVDWPRWYKRAVLKSAEQLWGAQRWLENHPDRLFLDRSCTQPLPLEIPPSDRARFHRIVVAHDTSGERRKLIGGSGSLMIMPTVSGDDHLRPEKEGGRPFVVGQVTPRKGFVHVLDEVSLEAVLSTLDTISDFVAYLQKKENFILSGRLGLAYGEEDLLAYYLKDINDAGEHDFILPDDGSILVLEEGHFANYMGREESVAKRAADHVSEIWDNLIEEFTGHVVAGTLYQSTDPSVQTQERILRVLAREPRVRRRMLSRGMLEKLQATPKEQSGIRTFGPSHPGDPWYVFLCAPESWGSNEREYREGRVAFLMAYCKVVKLENPDAETIVGIATETGALNRGRSHDLVLLDGTDWTHQDFEEAREIQEEMGFFKNVRRIEGSEPEYPVERYFGTSKKIGRNERCPCGSGNKYKRCCGRP